MKTTFGQRFRAARIAAGFRRTRDISHALDVCDSQVSTWEKDHTMPLAGAIVRIARTCGVTTDYLLGMEEAS